MKLVIHPTSARNLSKLKQNLPQSLLLIGDRGVGLTSIATSLAGEQLVAVIKPTGPDGEINLDRGEIRIDQIRQLTTSLRGKSSGVRVVILSRADTMNQNAQNAFLKLLEEPGGQVRLILTAQSTDQLLPTVLSRLQRVTIQPATTKQSLQLIEQLSITDPVKQRQLLYLANGRPGLIKTLADDQTQFDRLANITSDARQLVNGPQAKKFSIVDKYHADASDANELVNQLIHILHNSLHDHPSPQTRQLLAASLRAGTQLSQHTNTRLALLNIVV